MVDYSKLKALLEEQETFPHDFTLKFIGKNSSVFVEDVGKLESRNPTLKKTGERKSSGHANLALTYVFPAPTADTIIELLREVGKLRDLRVIL